VNEACANIFKNDEMHTLGMIIGHEPY